MVAALDRIRVAEERWRDIPPPAALSDDGDRLPVVARQHADHHASAVRVRDLEVKKLIERGDRLGAAVMLMAAGKREAAVETLTSLPGPKAFRFLQKAKLDAEALELARKEIIKADDEKKPGNKARWLELLGDFAQAAEAWEKAERKDRALVMQEQAGNWQKAAELAESIGQRDKAIELYHRVGNKAGVERATAMPIPSSPPPKAPASDDEGEGDEGPSASAVPAQAQSPSEPAGERPGE